MASAIALCAMGEGPYGFSLELNFMKGSIFLFSLKTGAFFSRLQIDWLIPHQANIRIITATAKRLELPMERVILTVREHGNTSAASVPMALDTAIRDGRIKRGDLLLLEAFGGGFTWGASLIRY